MEDVDNKFFHPWYGFLVARENAMRWLREEKKLSDIEIAETLSMDEEQVKSIFYFTDPKIKLIAGKNNLQG